MNSKAGALIIVTFAFMIGWILYETYQAYAQGKYDQEATKANNRLQEGLDYKGSYWLAPIKYWDLVQHSEENYETAPYWFDHAQNKLNKIQNGDNLT